MVSANSDAAHHMDRIYRFQRHIYDITRKPYLLGRDRLIEGLDVPDGGRVLEIACGTGRNLIQAAQHYPRSRFYGFDLSGEMLVTARQAVQKAGLEKRINIAQGDATNFDGEQLFGQPQFDRIIISYALSMIPAWQQVLPTALKQLAPGGSLHIVDFGQQSGLPDWFRAVLFTWLGHFSVTPRADLLSSLQSLAVESDIGFHSASLYRDYAFFAVLNRR